MSDFKVKGNLRVDAKLKLPAEASQRALTVDASGEVTSSNVTSTELGYLSGVTSPIQTQLSNNGTAIADHINDATDAHDASAISNVPAGNLAATDVQGALNELQSDVDARALDVDVIKKDGSVAFIADQSMGGNQLTNVGAPVASSDAATKSYVDSVAEGLKPKTAVRVATTANITLSGAQTIDGISAVAGNRVLVKDQTLAENNGIYIVAAGAWSRSTDFDSLTPIDEVNGAMVAVQEGTTNAGKVYVQSGFVTAIGTDPINFIFFNSSASLVGGDGITVSGSNISVDHDGEGLTFVATQLALELDGATLTKSAAGLKLSDTAVTPGTFGSANETVSITVDQQGRLTAASEQLISITASQVSDFNSAAQAAVSSPGDIFETNFSLANNQVTPANVTGLAFANAAVRSFEALVSVEIDATSDLFEVFTLRGIQKGASWDMSVTANGDDSLIVFSITNAGQVQYVSGNYAGFVSGLIKFRAQTTSF